MCGLQLGCGDLEDCWFFVVICIVFGVVCLWWSYCKVPVMDGVIANRLILILTITRRGEAGYCGGMDLNTIRLMIVLRGGC